MFCRTSGRIGHSGRKAPHGLRQGLNDFTGWFANDPNMKGTYFGYDGPAPPWNDSVVHHYTFTLYAIDVPKLEVKVDLTGGQRSRSSQWPYPGASKDLGHLHSNPTFGEILNRWRTPSWRPQCEQVKTVPEQRLRTLFQVSAMPPIVSRAIISSCESSICADFTFSRRCSSE
jgi:Phosphatidylethanolamine-binding protein